MDDWAEILPGLTYVVGVPVAIGIFAANGFGFLSLYAGLAWPLSALVALGYWIGS